MRSRLSAEKRARLGRPRFLDRQGIQRILTLGQKLGKRREIFGVARCMQSLASCATLGSGRMDERRPTGTFIYHSEDPQAG